jgi:hemerythrin
VAITWDPSLTIGVPEIDRQHAELFDRLDHLLEAARTGQTTEEVGKLLGYLGDYVVEHFGAEEALMRTRGYPGLEAHELEHRRFEQEFQALLREYLDDGATLLLVVRVNAKVTAWLSDHIYRTDKALAAFLSGAPGVGVVPLTRPIR